MDFFLDPARTSGSIWRNPRLNRPHGNELQSTLLKTRVLPAVCTGVQRELSPYPPETEYYKMSSRTWRPGSQCQGRTPTSWIAKTIMMPTTRIENQTLLPTASWYQICQGKHNTVQQWMEPPFCSYLERRHRAKSAPVVCLSPSRL